MPGKGARKVKRAWGLSAIVQWPAEGTTIGCRRIPATPQTIAAHLRIRLDSDRVAPTIAEAELFC